MKSARLECRQRRLNGKLLLARGKTKAEARTKLPSVVADNVVVRIKPASVVAARTRPDNAVADNAEVRIKGAEAAWGTLPRKCGPHKRRAPL